MSALRLCPAGCGKKFTKGARRPVLMPDGTIEVLIVCKLCAIHRALQIVIPSEPNACMTCRSGRRSRVCEVCSNEAAHKSVRMALKPWADFFRNQARIRKTQGHEWAPGLLAAAEYLESGDAVHVKGAAE